MDILGYTESGMIRVIFDGDETESFVPDDMENRHRQMIAEWEALGNTIPPYVAPEPQPLEQEPRRVACALRVPIVDGEVQQIGGAYRIAAIVMVNTGTFLAIFTQSLGETQPFVIPNNGISVSISEWGGDYATIEVRDHAGGTLITPASFGFSLYQV